MRKHQASRDSLLRGIKHELRTPLNAILGFADLLLGELDGPLQSDERENVQMVRDAGELLLSLINQVLDLGTALVQPAPPYLEEVDVVALLEQLRAEIEQRRGNAPVHVRVVTQEDALTLSVDHQQLARALRCLGEVALARTSAGEIALGVRLASQPAADGGIGVTVSCDGDAARGVRDAPRRASAADGGTGVAVSRDGDAARGVRRAPAADGGAPSSEQRDAGELAPDIAAPAIELWVGADGFCATAAADGGRSGLEALLALLANGPPVRDRAERSARFQLRIARRLFERQGFRLSVALREQQPVLCVRVPLLAAASAFDEAREADVALAVTYIAAMGHELRTPLNAITGFSDLLSRHGQHTWTAAQQRSVAIVHERACDLAGLVDAMIDWAKLEAGELTVKLAPVRVSALLEHVQRAATERSGARGLELMLHLPPQADVQLDLDEQRCVQALLGLLDHAIRSNPAPVVHIRVQRTAAELRIIVEDQGLQIRPEDQPGVFDAFRPSYAPTGQRIAGLQLGPALARSLLRAHGGDVWFESRPARGTTFTAVLPLPNSTDSA